MAMRPDVSSGETDEPLFSEEGPQVVSLSTMVPTDSLTRKVMATGIIGLYITVVLSVGRFLRMSLSRLVPKVICRTHPPHTHTAHAHNDLRACACVCVRQSDSI
jgi:hypothetical protein